MSKTRKPHSIVNSRELARVTKMIREIAIEFGMPNASWSVSPQLWSNAHEWAGEITRTESVSWAVSLHPAQGVCLPGYGSTADEALTMLREALIKHLAEANGAAA